MPDGRYRKQNDKEVWEKLCGEDELLATEAFGLAGLFGMSMEYLFAEDLRTLNGETLARIRWYESNQRREREHQEYLKREEITRELRDKPYLLDFMLEAVKWSQEELIISIEILQARKTA